VFAGTITDFKGAKVKALDLMRVNLESGSNEIDESDVQFKKHSEQRI
jgi:hypothetical protein